MRKLITSDLFSFSRMIGKAGVKEQFEQFIKEANDKKKAKNFNTEEFGIHVLVSLLDICGREGVDNAFYEFIAGPFELTPKEISELPITDLFPMFKQLLKTNDMASFFGAVGKLM